MIETVTIQGILTRSFHEAELQVISPVEANYDVLFINGDKRKLFHFADSTTTVQQKTKVISLKSASENLAESYVEISFFKDSSFYYLVKTSDSSSWATAVFADYSDQFANEHLTDNEPFIQSIRSVLYNKPFFDVI